MSMGMIRGEDPDECADYDYDMAYEQWREDWAERLEWELNETIDKLSKVTNGYYKNRRDKIIEHMISCLEGMRD